jgi:hypothetical protein
MPRVRVPCHIVRHVVWLIARLVINYFASCRLVVDYFAYAARPGASARCAARHVARRRLLHITQAHRRLLRLRCASGCFGMSRNSSSTASLTSRVWMPRHVARLLVDYFAYASRPGASARPTARRRLFRITQARRRLLCLRRASGCLSTSHDTSSTTSHQQAHRRLLRLRHTSGFLGTSRGSSSTTSHHAGSSSTTSLTPCVRLPRLVMDHAPSRRSTSRRSVALALNVHLVTAYCGVTTRCSDCIGSTAPMSCIRMCRLGA